MLSAKDKVVSFDLSSDDFRITKCITREQHLAFQSTAFLKHTEVSVCVWLTEVCPSDTVFKIGHISPTGEIISRSVIATAEVISLNTQSVTSSCYIQWLVLYVGISDSAYFILSSFSTLLRMWMEVHSILLKSSLSRSTSFVSHGITFWV